MTREDLHRLVDELPDVAVDAMGRVLQRAVHDPMIAVLDAAPWDDEPVTEEEERAVAEAIRRIDAGEGSEWTKAKKLLETDDD